MQAGSKTFSEKSEMTPFSERLKNLRHSLRLSQADMGARLAVSKNYIWQLEAGTKEPGPRLVREVELMEKSPELAQSSGGTVGGTVPFAPSSTASGGLSVVPGDIMREQRVSLRYVPLLSYAQMGSLTSYEEIPRGWQQNVPTDVTDPNAFAVTLMGDSMEPQYKEGDIAILLPSAEPRPASLVVVLMNDGSVVCKIYSRKGNQVTLTSYNNKLYKPYVVNAADVRRVYPVHSVMKIVWK